MQSAPTKNSGWVVALGVVSLSLVAGLACPGNLSPELANGGGPGGGGGGGPQTCDAPALMAMKCGTTDSATTPPAPPAAASTSSRPARPVGSSAR